MEICFDISSLIFCVPKLLWLYVVPKEMPWPLLILDLPLPLLVFAWSSWVKELTFAFCTVDIATIAIKYFEAKSFDEHLLPTRLNHKFLAPSQMSSLLQVIQKFSDLVVKCLIKLTKVDYGLNLSVYFTTKRR